MNSIAICVTERNRPLIFKQCLDNIKKFQPKNSRIFIVDDASDNPVQNSDYRFDTNVGIAAAKNKCLELAYGWGADHIFLFDSDCWPKHKDWWKPYVDSIEPHLMYIFVDFADKKGRLKDNRELYRSDDIVAYSHVRGCMLYINKEVLDKVGGFDTRYREGMFEHTDWTNRIFNAGLTTFRIMDVPGSDQLIHSEDEYQAVKSSIPQDTRRKNLSTNRALYQESFNHSNYYEYREKAPCTGNNVLLTTYLTSTFDTQRQKKWQANLEDVEPLIKSVGDRVNLKILNDCFDNRQSGSAEFIRVNSSINPYFERWIAIYRYLKENPDIDNVFCIDSTDVLMLKSPFDHMEYGFIYSCEEKQILGCQWMVKNTVSNTYSSFLRRNYSAKLYNCGIVGGSRADVMDIARGIYTRYFDGKCVEPVEMPIYNFLIHNFYGNRVKSGFPLHTEFKKYDVNNKECFFAHK